MFFAKEYKCSPPFYQDWLEFAIVHASDRGHDDQGTVFGPAFGPTWVLNRPRRQEPDSVWDYQAPQGVMVAVETQDVDEYGVLIT